MKSIAALAVLAVAISGATAWAEEATPRVDGGVTAGPAAAKPGEAKVDGKEPKKAPAMADDLVSPDAAMKLDEEDLIKKLTGDDKPEAGGLDKKFETIINRMGDSATRLKKEDPGEVTQQIHKRIMTDLDVLIDLAKKSESSGSSKDQQKKPGQKKGESKGNQSGQKPGTGMGGNTAASESTLREGSATAAPGADIHDVNPERWHNLPPADRDIIVQGMKESVLPPYEAMMAKFYETLAKTNKPK